MSSVRLNLEFAPQARNASLPALALFAFSVLWFSAIALYAAKAVYENSRRQQDLSALEGARYVALSPPLTRPTRADPAELARVQFVRLTSRNLAAPWADLLSALETAPSNVALLSVEPSAAKRTVSLIAEAAGPVEMIKYLQALQSDPRLSNVVLVSHQVQLQAPGTPIRFQLRAAWGESP